MKIGSDGSNASSDMSAVSNAASTIGATLCEPSSRRAFLASLAKISAALVAVPLVASRVRAQGTVNTLRTASAAGIAVMVYKDAGCGCCKEWIKHMQKAGFTVTWEDTTKLDAIKTKLGVPGALASCHTDFT